MINKLQELKGKTKLKFYRNVGKFNDKMKYKRQINKFQFEEDPFSKDGRGISKTYNEVLLLMNFLQPMPQVKIMPSNWYDLHIL